MTIYDIFFAVFSVAYLPYLLVKGKAHKDFAQRLGKLKPSLTASRISRPIWLHAVSVGEVAAAKNFIQKLREKFPDKKIVLSTTTKTGNDVANKLLREDIVKFYFPLDFSFIVRKVVSLVNPSIFIVMETEIWPNLINALSKRKIPIVMINGRISDRSYKGYRRVKFLFEGILKKINHFCMQSPEDAGRIEALGAEKAKIKVTGNMKFDTVPLQSFKNPKEDLIFGAPGKLIIAGSTHPGEEEIIFEVYKKLLREFSDLKLLIAPRHVERSQTIKKLSEKYGFETMFFSSQKGRFNEGGVLILDTIGELSHLYRFADVVFMGGSLVKKGGHNLVEPAIFGKPIVFGPYMSNFRVMAKLFLENTAAVQIRSKDDLLNILRSLLKNTEERKSLGKNAKRLLDASSGATDRNVCEVAQFIST
ncbi:MAG: 3-deoxy-D-manno-octulosonic acid transferase [Candidatus Omnitrophota bacterium]